MVARAQEKQLVSALALFGPRRDVPAIDDPRPVPSSSESLNSVLVAALLLAGGQCTVLKYGTDVRCG